MTARPTTLADWLGYLETLHPKAIAMGLDRVRAVFERLNARPACTVITVSGTNGKGSTCAMLDAILRSAGYRVGVYTSPHLLRYNERVAVAGVALSDAALVEAFNAVEDARNGGGAPVPLTYFEFGTLAALWSFARKPLDVVVLEVGLGGRLDAVNVVDADAAVITSVDLDHMDYLGPTREEIGREKAGIVRAGRPAICGEPDPPVSLLAQVESQGARLVRIGRDYGFEAAQRQWRYWGPGGPLNGLPHPALRGAHQLGNAATALAALGALRDVVPVHAGAVREGLLAVTLPGRFMVLPGRPVTVLDVAHNPHAAGVLAGTLATMGFHAQTHAVFAMLKDKDIRGVIDAVRTRVDRWHVAGLPGARGGGAGLLRDQLRSAGVVAEAIRVYDDVADAYRGAQAAAGDADRIVVFGSFLTVAAALSTGRSDLATRSAT